MNAFAPVSRHAALAVAILIASVAAGPPATASESPASCLACASPIQFQSRPSPWDECLAWKVHVFALIDDHRMAGDIDDDALFDIMRDFYAAQHECSTGNFVQGLRLYDAIQIGRVIGLMH
jgi:hypothetical protein